MLANLSSWFLTGSNKGIKVYENIRTPGEPQQRALAVGRGVIGTVSIAFEPYFAISGAVFAGLFPNLTEKIVRIADGALTGIWNSMGFNMRAVSVIVGTSLVATGYAPGIITTCAAIFSAKISAEYVLKNLKREQIASQNLALLNE